MALDVQFYVADQNPHRDRSLGITQYTDHLLRHLAGRDDVALSCLTSRSSYRPALTQVRVKTLPFRTDHVAGRLLADQCHTLLHSLRSNVYHFPKGYLSRLGRPSVPTVGTVHDTIIAFYAKHYPRSRSRLALSYWCGQFARSLPRFDLILTVSQFSKDSIQAFCTDRRIRCPPITVTYEGARWESEPPDARTKGTYVVHLASRQPHKRTGTLLARWGAMQATRVDLPELRLIGSLSTDDADQARRLRRVTVRPALSESSLKDELAGALALIMSSEIEGFGLPALEAYYLGTPVVYVADTAVQEVLGHETPGAFRLDGGDSFATALDEVLALDPPYIRSKADALRARFAWARCAERTMAAYRTLV